jgi:hypothetical protein
MRFTFVTVFAEEIPFAYRDKRIFSSSRSVSAAKPAAFSMHSSDKSSLSVASPQRIVAFGSCSLKNSQRCWLISIMVVLIPDIRRLLAR